MPYRIRWEGYGVYRRFHGLVTQVDFDEANEEMMRDLRYPGIRYIISDYLDAEAGSGLTELSLELYGRKERLHVAESPDIVRASVAVDAEVLTFLQYRDVAELAPYPYAVFPTVAEARTWIANNPRPAWRKQRSS